MATCLAVREFPWTSLALPAIERKQTPCVRAAKYRAAVMRFRLRKSAMGAADFGSQAEQKNFNPTCIARRRSVFSSQRAKSIRYFQTDQSIVGEWFVTRLTTMSLEPIHPEMALELYLADRESELTEATLYSHKSRISHFVRWCDEQDIENLNTLTGRQLHHYRLWRREEGDLSIVSEKTQMDTIRVFIRWLEQVDGVEPDLSTKVRSPTITPEQNTRHEMLDSEQATKVLAHLEKYEYASLQHVTIALLWHTMMRIGAAHSLDLDDYSSEEQYFEIKHRPEEETPIKNKEKGERYIALSEQICDLLDDWIADKRPNVTDEYGRKPLLATQQGRAHRTTYASTVTWLLSPAPTAESVHTTESRKTARQRSETRRPSVRRVSIHMRFVEVESHTH